jgi:hypothetical protein
MYGKPGTGKLAGFYVVDDSLDEMIAAAKLPPKKRAAKLREIGSRNQEKARESAEEQMQQIIAGERPLRPR